MYPEQLLDLFVRAPSQPAFGADAEVRRVLMRRGDSRLSSLDAVANVDQADVEPGLRGQLQAGQRDVVLVVGAVLWHREMDVVQRTREGSDDPVGHLDRSEEHTSELQSLMRTSYAAF